jgi:chaperonin cofactor prefoldin
MLNRRADEVKSLQKVMANTEKQFIDCLQQIKTLGEEKEKRQKELEELKAQLKSLLRWWTHGRTTPKASPHW